MEACSPKRSPARPGGDVGSAGAGSGCPGCHGWGRCHSGGSGGTGRSPAVLLPQRRLLPKPLLPNRLSGAGDPQGLQSGAETSDTAATSPEHPWESRGSGVSLQPETRGCNG